jgi:hypothetical protein
MSLGIENDGVAERWYAACLRCAGVQLLNLSFRQAGKSGVKVVHAHGPAAEHLRFLPESFYQPVIRSAVHIDGEQPDELADRGELRACNLHVPRQRGRVRIDVQDAHSGPVVIEVHVVGQ